MVGAGGLLWLGNIEVEQVWGAGQTALPRLGSASGSAIVGRMDEFALWPAGADDIVVLKGAPDPDFLNWRSDLGLPAPTWWALDGVGSLGSVSEDLRQAARTGQVGGLQQLISGHRLMAHGFSVVEGEVAAVLGIELAGAAPDRCRAVNGKVYSRQLAEQEGIRQPAGRTCSTTAEWDEAMSWARPRLERRPVVIKESFGVSGKGLAVIESVRRLDRVAGLVRAAAERNDGRIAFCVEEWVDKDRDLNYQFEVAPDGAIRLQVIKEAITEHGVHRGHRFPVSLTAAQRTEIEATAAVAGARLAADGYSGVVGIDALIDTSGTLFPMIEINARLNMASYQEPVRHRLVADGSVLLAKHYDLSLTRPLPFATVAAACGELLITSPHRPGLLVLNHATVNAAMAIADGPGPRPGRLYAMIAGRDQAEVDDIDTEVTARLAGLETTEENRRAVA